MAAIQGDPTASHRRYWPETFDPLFMPLVMALHCAYEDLRRQRDGVFARHGLTPAEFDVLATLRRSPPPHVLTPSEVQRGMFITSGGLTKVLQLLETKGLIVRTTSDTDRRSKPVHLSPVAIELIETAVNELNAAIRTTYGNRFSEKEIGQLTRLLGRLQCPSQDAQGETKKSA